MRYKTSKSQRKKIKQGKPDQSKERGKRLLKGIRGNKGIEN